MLLSLLKEATPIANEAIIQGRLLVIFGTFVMVVFLRLVCQNTINLDSDKFIFTEKFR